MKRVLSFWLFWKRPGDGFSKQDRVIYWCWNVLMLVLGAVTLGVLSLMLAPGSYGWELFGDYWGFPVVILLNLLPPVLLALLLYAAVGRTWIALLITALPVLGLSLGSYYKLFFRDDPVIASDLTILAEAGKMAGQYHLFVDFRVGLAVVCTAVFVVALALFARGRPGWKLRLGFAGVGLCAALALIPVYGDDAVYNKIQNYEHISRWSSTQQYISRGLLYPFLHSVKDALPDPPEGYSEKEAAALLAQYEDGEIPEDKKVNVVGVMLEAFNDFSIYDQIEMQTDLYAIYHRLEEESYTGNLVTNIFAGGTVDTERAFLTGMGPKDINYRSNTSSYVWYLKNQGYRASGDHPSNNWFYNRVNINSYLGFDEYRFSEDHYYDITGSTTAFDNIFFQEVTASITDQIYWGGGVPVFSFSVSYQGHGPYSDNICWWGEVENYIANYDMEETDRTILANYLGSVLSTQVYLSGMIDACRFSDEPIVVVAFGDHKPWLGNGNTVYNALDISLKGDTKESFYNCWSTRYMIWANDAAKKAIGNDLVGEGPDISPCFLMNVLFDQLGWEGDAYMQAVDECWREVPVIHVQNRYVTADGELKGAADLTEEQAALVQRFRCLEYYRQHHFAY